MACITKRYKFTHNVFTSLSRERIYTENSLPGWLPGWFIASCIITLDIGESVNTDFYTITRVENGQYEDGESCDHPGCLHHVSHPCEGCGRTHGRTNNGML